MNIEILRINHGKLASLGGIKFSKPIEEMPKE